MALREHLFISYASEDRAFTSWLALRLTCEGYKVWCDQYKLLGGEPYPTDITKAIQNDTFRFLAVLSKNSLEKENPLGERTLALNVGKKRGERDFFIPLNLDGLKPEELDFMTSPITFIPFYHSWYQGLIQLLKKLKSIKTPDNVKNGRDIVTNINLDNNFVKKEPEKLFSNHLKILEIPTHVKKFILKETLTSNEKVELEKRWAFYTVTNQEFFSFHSPADDIAKLFNVQYYRKKDISQEEIEGIKTYNIVSSLIKKSLKVKCFEKGLTLSDDKRHIYFPFELLEKNKIKFEKTKRYPIKACGVRKYLRAGESQLYRYHLSPVFNIREYEKNDFYLFFKINLFLTDLRGCPLKSRLAISRRKNICKAWFNHEWFIRNQAIIEFLSGGESELVLGNLPDERIIISSNFLNGEIPIRIDEEYIASLKDKSSDEFLIYSQESDSDENGNLKDEEPEEDEEYV